MRNSNGFSAQIWRRELEDLAIASCAAPASEELRLTHQLLKLLSDVPDSSMIAGVSSHALAELSMMHGRGFSNSEILNLISPECPFMISHDGNQMFIASIFLPYASEEATANGSTLALALAGAISIGLSDRLTNKSENAGSYTRSQAI